MKIYEYDWQPIRLVDIQPGDQIAREIRLGLTSDIVDIFEEEGGYSIGNVVSVKKSARTNIYTITYDNGDTESFKEPQGCYCDCRDYYVTIKIVEVGSHEIEV